MATFDGQTRHCTRDYHQYTPRECPYPALSPSLPRTLGGSYSGVVREKKKKKKKNHSRRGRGMGGGWHRVRTFTSIIPPIIRGIDCPYIPCYNTPFNPQTRKAPLMAISQYRILDLLIAADDCLQALEKFRTEIQAELTLYHTGQITAIQSLYNINDITRLESTSRIKLKTIQTIATERAHFTPTAIRYNDRARLKQARRRGVAPAIPQTALGGPPLPKVSPATFPFHPDPGLAEDVSPATASPNPRRAKDDSEGIISPDEDVFDDLEEGGPLSPEQIRKLLDKVPKD